MGLFDLFGGGSKTVVQQAASNTTNVEVGVGIENIIDMTGIVRVLEWLGLKQTELQEQQVQATTQGTMTAQQLLASMQETASKELKQKQQVIDVVVPWFKALAAAGITALIVFAWKKWKGRK